ncbi:type II toxin-antitoxin system RelE/ParE family toxin [Adonisia turfae]|uniref:type II toxin-antitoxin system RelE/ParE family toxin n=1 Tax=Adonisia turfae TaxID=2950184 RepID=UPI0021F8F421
MPPIKIKVTREFQRKVRTLTKKYRRIQSDLQPVLDKLSKGDVLGDRIQGTKAIVYKLRIKNSDIQKGKSGGYRLIYWLQLSDSIVLLDIYSKSEQDNMEVSTIQRIIENFE